MSVSKKIPLFLLWLITLYSCNGDGSENLQIKSEKSVYGSDTRDSSGDKGSISSSGSSDSVNSPEVTVTATENRIIATENRIYRQSPYSIGYASRGPLHRSASVLDEALSQAAARHEALNAESCSDDLTCLMMASNDRLGLEAIRSLHRQLDDDANGAVDLSESVEFLREELQYEDGAEKRQRAFHRNDDMHISVKELWEAWLRSEVHNWTVEQTTDWLATNVELPQYVPVFIVNKVTGATLPRLAVSNMQYLSNVLGIKDPIHKQKIALKAMDVVLFGPPKDTTHHLKDLILVTLLLGALIGCWYAYRQNKNSRKHLRRMMKDMESLHKAEVALETLQKELERARQEQEYATTEKQDLERRLQQHSGDSELRTSYSDLEVSQLKAEIEMLRSELQRAEGELEDRCWSPPVGLQQWLQLTHEIENKAYVKKKLSAEKQLQQAREACEKLRKKRSSLVGAFVSTHGKTIDDVDRSIVEARTALNEVTQELAERVHRWKQIEMMCGFNIINNSGLAVLESVLYRNTANGRGIGLRGMPNQELSVPLTPNNSTTLYKSQYVDGGVSNSDQDVKKVKIIVDRSMYSLNGRMSSSQDDLDDDASSCSPSTDRGFDGQFGTWREHEAADSSESEKLDLDEDDLRTNVHFTVGGVDQDDTATGASRLQLSSNTSSSPQLPNVPPPIQHRTSSSDFFNKSSRMSRSYSQDIHPEPVIDFEPTLPKMSQSETNLDIHNPGIVPVASGNQGVLSSSTNTMQYSAPPPTSRTRKMISSTSRSRFESPQSTVDEETLSTDSNSIIDENLTTSSNDNKTKTKKFHFPKFRKNKSSHTQSASSSSSSMISSKPT